jgi:hypothetical protein
MSTNILAPESLSLELSDPVDCSKRGVDFRRLFSEAPQEKQAEILIREG